MEIRIADGTVSIRNANDLKSFKTVVHFAEGSLDAIQEALLEAGQVEDGAVWYTVDWLKRASGMSGTNDWDERFDAMIDFADRHGWIREGACRMVRSHVEWVGVDSRRGKAALRE
jgi:hypothetical protein